MRLCLIVLEMPVGGLERSVIFIANNVANRGIPVRLLILENDDNSLIHLLDPSIEICCMTEKGLCKLVRLRQLTRSHVVHLHFWGGHVRPLYRLALLGRRPMFSTYHNIFYQRSQFWNLLDVLFSKQLSGVIAISETVRDFCINVVHIPESKLTLIYQGIVGSATLPKARPADTELQLLSVARIVEQKDHHTLIRGLAAVWRQGYCPRLTIVGDGPLLESTHELARRLNVDDEIIWMGEIHNENQLHTLVQDADIFVTTSLWEGQGLAVLEAMAEGKPVIASDIHPHREVLGDAGIYFPPQDADALAKAIASFYNDPSLRVRAGEAAWQRSRLFTLERTVEAHMTLYGARNG